MPRPCFAEKRDELAWSHRPSSSPGVKPTTSLKNLYCASQQIGPPHFRIGAIALKKGSRSSANNDSVCLRLSVAEACLMGRQTGDQSQLFYLFNLEQRIPR